MKTRFTFDLAAGTIERSVAGVVMPEERVGLITAGDTMECEVKLVTGAADLTAAMLGGDPVVLGLRAVPGVGALLAQSTPVVLEDDIGTCTFDLHTAEIQALVDALGATKVSTRVYFELQVGGTTVVQQRWTLFREVNREGDEPPPVAAASAATATEKAAEAAASATAANQAKLDAQAAADSVATNAAAAAASATSAASSATSALSSASSATSSATAAATSATNAAGSATAAATSAASAATSATAAATSATNAGNSATAAATSATAAAASATSAAASATSASAALATLLAAAVTIGTTSIAIGSSATAIAGLTSVSAINDAVDHNNTSIIYARHKSVTSGMTPGAGGHYGVYGEAIFNGDVTVSGVARYKAGAFWAGTAASSAGTLTLNVGDVYAGNITGVDAHAYHHGTGTMATMFGVRAQITNTIAPNLNGVTTNLASEVAAFFADSPALQSGNTITSYHGLWVKGGAITAGSSIGTRYGVKVDTQTGGTTIWGLYVETDRSYFGGQAQFTSGTAAAPSISFSSDTDTGWYFDGTANSIAGAFAGAQSLRIGATDAGGFYLRSTGNGAQFSMNAAGAISATAAGTNQSITLTPSGSGKISSTSDTFIGLTTTRGTTTVGGRVIQYVGGNGADWVAGIAPSNDTIASAFTWRYSDTSASGIKMSLTTGGNLQLGDGARVWQGSAGVYFDSTQVQLQVAGTSALTVTSSVVNVISGTLTLANSAGTLGISGTELLYGSASTTTAHTARSTSTATSGTLYAFKIAASYNQASGSAANTDLLVSRTVTAVGSGTQLLADFQLGGTSQVSIDTAGLINFKTATANTTGLKFGTNTYLFQAGGGIVTLASSSGNDMILRFGASGGTNSASIHSTQTASAADNNLVFKTNNLTALTISSAQVISTTTTITCGGNLYAGSGNYLAWTSRSVMQSPSDGVITLTNAAGSDFNRQQYGGTTNAFPAWKRNGSYLEARLADDSASTNIIASGALPNGNASVFSIYNGGSASSRADFYGPNHANADQTRFSNASGGYVSFSQTNTATSGTVQPFRVTMTYNQASGTAANTDFLINRTETALGSGAQYLFDAQVGGTSRFNITNSGVTSIAYSAAAAASAAESMMSINGTGVSGGSLSTFNGLLINASVSGSSTVLALNALAPSLNHNGSNTLTTMSYFTGAAFVAGSGNVTDYAGFSSRLRFSGAGNVTGTVTHYRILGVTKSSTGDVTGSILGYDVGVDIGRASAVDTTGFRIVNQTIGSGSVYGFRGGINSATGKWNVYMDGTANNHMAGNLLLGTTADGMTAGGSLAVAGDFAHRGTLAGFFNTTPIAKPTVTGSRGGNAALASLLTQLAALGLLTDSSS